MKAPRVPRFIRCCVPLVVGVSLLSSCFVFSSKNTKSSGKQGAGASVLGASLGARAANENAAGLDALYAVAATHAPAPVRPDPDTAVRNLLLQYRETGSTVAREIGRVEQYRSLLGGANVTFTVVPQEGYDATSLLAEMKVADEVCGSLVDPNESDHPGWKTILPADPANSDANLNFLAQRILGIPSAQIDPSSIATMKEIIGAAKVNGRLANASYIPACSTLLLDAEGLLL